MPISDKRLWALMALLWWFTAPAGGREQMPIPKPFHEGREIIEVGEVDIPRPKPETSKPHLKVPVTARSKEDRCDIFGAQFVPKEPVTGGPPGSPLHDDTCGIRNPVGLAGFGFEEPKVTFPEPVLVSCKFAQVVSDWVLSDVVPAGQKIMGSSLTRIASGPGYQCRRRNNLPSGKLSEHALGRALDISHFEFQGGAIVSIEHDWASDTKKGAFLKEIHAAACKRFTTVLGPDADPNHQSHFHLDIGCHGQDCTYLICQ